MREQFDHSHYRSELERSQQRLADLTERGVDALSRYDIEIAYGGDAQQALDTAKWLVGNHVSYFGSKLEELGPEIKQTTLFEMAGDVSEEPRCPHGRVGGCWACQDENDPHAEFAQDMHDAAVELSRVQRAPDEHLEDLYEFQQSGDEDF